MIKFKYYVMNYDHHKKQVIPFNVFRNISVNDSTYQEIKKYLRAPSKYNFQQLTGFSALSEKLKTIIMCEEWARYEYEISVGKPFEENYQNLQKVDCYEQCKDNIDAITREVIWQYKNPTADQVIE